jgi:hypothetical protein
MTLTIFLSFSDKNKLAISFRSKIVSVETNNPTQGKSPIIVIIPQLKLFAWDELQPLGDLERHLGKACRDYPISDESEEPRRRFQLLLISLTTLFLKNQNNTKSSFTILLSKLDDIIPLEFYIQFI